ncbi:peptidylprolyl isomerase [Gracilibacillus sp. D59]|uniref:peptidylprolyl isomerase n=1 Tax=Gracilibacillus sp. D59 TaxID=3457434 RepID=UPI003FCED6AB
MEKMSKYLTQLMRKRRKAFLTMCLFITATGITLFLYFISSEAKNNEVIATVNDMSIVEKEFRLQLNNFKPDVQNYFKNSFGAEITDDFWEEQFDRENPMKLLKEQALAEAVKAKIELSLARDHELINFVSYDELLEHLQKENEKRQKAISKGEVVYGLASFSENQYYRHVIKNIRLNLKEILSRNESDPLYPTEKELQSSFNQNLDEWSDKKYAYTIHKISIPYHDSASMKNAEVKAKKALSHLENGKSFEEVSREYNEDNKILSQTMSDETSRGEKRSTVNLRTAVESLEVGDFSNTIIHENGSYNIIKLVNKESGDTEVYQENKDLIRNMVVDEKYDKYIQELTDNAEITINQSNYDKVNPK